MNFSKDFKINVNKENSLDKIIVLIEIRSNNLKTSFFICDDNKSIEVEGNVYLPFPFKFEQFNQIQGEIPQAKIIIPNFSKQLVKLVDETLGARNTSIIASITRRSSLIKEHEIKFNIDNTKVDFKNIIFNISIQNNLVKSGIRWKYDTEHAVGLT